MKIPAIGATPVGPVIQQTRNIYEKLEQTSQLALCELRGWDGDTDPNKSAGNASELSRPSTATRVHRKSSESEDLLLSRSDMSYTKQQHTEPKTPSSVPATVIFDANAYPLYLPELDNFLSNLPAKTFPPYTSDLRVGCTGMFPPMDQLTATGKSLRDLENNNVIPPTWRNRNSIFGSLLSIVLGVTGSSAVAAFYSLQGIIDTIQIFALVISSVVSLSKAESKWKSLFLGVIPNVLALNFGTTMAQSTLFLGLFIIIIAGLLFYFWSKTRKCDPNDVQEGFTSSTDGSLRIILVSFILSALYLPLSTILVHALVWSDDFWAVSNPYTNSTVNPPDVMPLGPSDQFYDPLDFCYTTTMRRNEFNYAPIIVGISAIAFATYTIWFPIRLYRVIIESVPIVDLYSELGKPRSKSELDREYQRVLERDKTSFSFLYQAFRRGWGTYRSFYLYAKLSALVIIAIIQPDNCIFRTLNRDHVSIAQQSVLTSAMLVFFLLQCFWTPFIDPVNNASEWTSRLSYVLTSLVGLAIATGVPGQIIYDGPLLYVIYIITYGFSTYFTFIDLSCTHRIIKRITRRIDFSIDIFSPRLDISPHSIHIKRRIWQESVTTVFLTSPQTKIPVNQKVTFHRMRNFIVPPYLLNFKGSPAERHVENLKILREIGLSAYVGGLSSYEGNLTERELHDCIARSYVGTDMYWEPSDKSTIFPGVFGMASWIPFPPTLVIRLDNGSTVVLQQARQFRSYVKLNSSKEIRRKRNLRLALRALEGQIVEWPYAYRKHIGNNIGCCFRRYNAQTVVHYRSCVVKIRRKGCLIWKNTNLGSGFEVELVYAKDVTIGMADFGVDDNWELSPAFARFLALNQRRISGRVGIIEEAIDDFRQSHYEECIWKSRILSYHSLISIYDKPQHIESLTEAFSKESDIRVRDMLLTNQDAFSAANDRFRVVTSSRIAVWWYVFWDDLWRRNHNTIKALELHATDFSPYYPCSVAYKPLPRAALEAFLTQRGLYNTRRKAIFTTGLLNKIYFRLNEIVFHEPRNGIILHIGEGTSELHLSAVDAEMHARDSSLGTGGGTDHDDSSIRARPNYRWEGILEDPLLRSDEPRRRAGWKEKLGVWLGLTRLWRTGMMSRGLALDVELRDGKYHLL